MDAHVDRRVQRGPRAPAAGQSGGHDDPEAEGGRAVGGVYGPALGPITTDAIARERGRRYPPTWSIASALARGGWSFRSPRMKRARRPEAPALQDRQHSLLPIHANRPRSFATQADEGNPPQTSPHRRSRAARSSTPSQTTVRRIAAARRSAR